VFIREDKLPVLLDDKQNSKLTANRHSQIQTAQSVLPEVWRLICFWSTP
jgi:hypothetical protein